MPGQRLQEPFQWAKVPIPFVGGVDTRTDRKIVAAPKLGLLENAVFVTPGSLRKRYGYKMLANLALDVSNWYYYDQPITNAHFLMTRQDSLWMRGAVDVHSYSPDRQRWQREAQIPDARVTYGNRVFPSQSAGTTAYAENPERATTNGITLLAFDNRLAGVNAQITQIFTDVNGTELGRSTVAGRIPRAAVIDQYIVLFYLDSTFGKLSAIIYDTNTFHAGRPLTAVNVVNIVTDVNTMDAITYDVDGSPFKDRILVAYNSSAATSVKLFYFKSDGTVDPGGITITTAFAPACVACAAEPSTGNVMVVWSMTGTNRTDGQMFNSVFTGLFVQTSLATPTGNPAFENVACVFRDPTIAEIFSDHYVLGGSWIDWASLTTGGSKTQYAAWARGDMIASKPWSANGYVHILVYKDAEKVALQKTIFHLVSNTITFPLPCTLGAYYPAEAIGVAALDRVKPCRVDVVDTVAWITPMLANAAFFAYSGMIGIDSSGVTPCFGEAGDSTYFVGSSLWMIDGTSVTEAGFLEFPEIDNPAGLVSTSASGGGLVGGHSYSYRAYYEWYSNAGERYQSTCGADVVVALPGGNDTIQIIWPSLRRTNKTNVTLAVYRTLADGTIFHRVATAFNDPTVDTITVSDGVSDTTASTAAIDYRSSSPPELSNIAPPPGNVLCMGNTRAFLSGCEDVNLIVASKLRGFGEALNWNPALQIRLPEGDGPVTALATLGDSVLAFRLKAIYIIGGDGPDNVGQNGSFMQPRIISQDIGCVAPNAIVRTPNGLIFKSLKGLYLLGGDLSIIYIGADVEGYNSVAVTAAVAIPDRHEARFTLADGHTLLFDYLARQWSVFTVGGLHAVLWQNRHTYLPDATGGARAETIGAYLDDGASYGWAHETAWLHVGENQNHQRVRKIQLLGEWMGN